MTYQDAIKRLKVCGNECLDCICCKEHDDAAEIAIIALEKQIPKKPIFHHYYEYEEDGVQSDYSYYTCANRCHKYCQVNPQDGFCRKCGQAIDWSDN